MPRITNNIYIPFLFKDIIMNAFRMLNLTCKVEELQHYKAKVTKYTEEVKYTICKLKVFWQIYNGRRITLMIYNCTIFLFAYE